MSVQSKPNREGEAPAEPECDEFTLPQGWAMPLLGEVATIKQGNSKLTKKTYKPDGKYVAFSGSGPDGLVDEFAFEGDAIVLSAVGARCGKCFRASGQWTAIANTAVIRTRIDDPTLLEYLFLLVNDENFWPKGGTAQPFVQTGQAQRETRIPLAPLAEQRRIVRKLELLLGKVSSNQQRLSRVPGLLKRFRQSVLAAACSGKLTADWREENEDIEPASTLRDRVESQLGRPLAENEWEEQPLDVPPSWEWVQAGDLCRKSSTITYGILKPVWVPQGVPTVRVQDMKAGMIAVDNVGQCSPERAQKFSKTSLEVGDLLIAKDGATLGKTAFVPPSLAGGNVTQHVLRFPITRCVAPVFVRLIIDSGHGQEWMRLETKGVALPGVNVGDFRRMPVPLPSLSEQQEIVRRVEKLFAFADQIEARLRQAQAHVDRLTQSLLAKAFRGELVPTEHALATAAGREYESASELLAQIQAEQNSTTATDKPKRKRVQQSRGSSS